jgi:hypothetical protein
VPSELTDEELLVFIVGRDGVELDFGAIGDWAADRLARFKVPRYYRADRCAAEDLHAEDRQAPAPSQRRRPVEGIRS